MLCFLLSYLGSLAETSFLFESAPKATVVACVRHLRRPRLAIMILGPQCRPFQQCTGHIRLLTWIPQDKQFRGLQRPPQKARQRSGLKVGYSLPPLVLTCVYTASDCGRVGNLDEFACPPHRLGPQPERGGIEQRRHGKRSSHGQCSLSVVAVAMAATVSCTDDNGSRGGGGSPPTSTIVIMRQPSLYSYVDRVGSSSSIAGGEQTSGVTPDWRRVLLLRRDNKQLRDFVQGRPRPPSC